VAGILAAGFLLAARADATELTLKDGRVLRGRKGETSGIAEVSAGGENEILKQIIFVNDDFRITFVSRRQVQGAQPENQDDSEKFICEQPRYDIGKSNKLKVISVGPPAGELKQFDEHGRRIYPLRTARGEEKIVQVITEITPQYARVEALKFGWDMRIATSTIDDATLEKLLMHQISPKNVEHRKKVIRFFLQCKRYGKAVELLEKLLKEGIADTKDQQDLEQTRKILHLMYAQQMLDELGLRRIQGQHELVQKYLDKFPNEDVSGEILQTVRQVKQQYADFELQRQTIRGELDKLLLLIPGQPERAQLAPALRVIKNELNAETMPRMAAYLAMRNAPGAKPDELLSLAVGGWLVGSDVATPDLPLMLSAWRMHRHIRDYLAEPMKVKRTRILPNIITEAAAQPAIIAAMAARMKPPYALPELVDETVPGFYKVEVEVANDQPSVSYFVQLPPEYDPLRRYPMVVSLHAVGMDPEMEIDWWAGDKPERHGQAGRNGYIVIAPAWTVEHQEGYKGTPREHAVVLACMRDACRRFAVDTDRVFLSGHSSGGDAAWDIGVSHPDLWAGVMPISAEALYSCKFYTNNARYVPFYVVLGELDGGRITRDAMVLDRYLKSGYNTTVVEYLGRGHEHFVDEQLSLIDWMGRCKRSFPLPREREFNCETMRSTDNCFWWAEVAQLPANSAVINWPAPKGTKPLLIHASAPVNNSISLTAGNLGATIWLSPEMVDFKTRINITLGGRRPAGVPPMIKPSVETMLEDLRIRGDRQHPFWAKVEAK
jgi:pimeloyl-ACP methyl ester carboxylesterase